MYALRAAVEQAKILLDKEKLLSELLVKSCPITEKKISLEAAFAYHRQLTHPQCFALGAAICRLHAAQKPTLYQYETVISLYETLQVILAEREALSPKTPINIADLSIVMNQEAVSGTEDGKQGEEQRKTWIEALAQDQADLPNFFKTVKKEQTKNKIRRHYEKLLERERKALEPPLCDYRSPKNRESCDSDADEGCEEKKCFRHCWGPCEVHPETFSSSFSSFEDEQDPLNIPLSDVDDW